MSSADHHNRALGILAAHAATFIRNEANQSPLITVTRTSASRDFRSATIFVTVYPETDEDKVVHFLTRKGTEFRDFLKKESAFARIPFCDFVIDRGERLRQHLDEVAREIEKKD